MALTIVSKSEARTHHSADAYNRGHSQLFRNKISTCVLAPDLLTLVKAVQ